MGEAIPGSDGRSQSLIEAHQLEVGYETLAKGGDARLVAIADFGLKVESGEFVVLIGPSGCGKTTFLNCVAGLMQPWRGQLLYDGGAIGGPGPDRAMVFQDYALMPWRTVYTNIRLPFELKARRGLVDDIPDRVHEIIKAVGLSGFERSLPHELSGGMRQRVGLGRALASEPRVLLADEPFGAVDAITREILQGQLEGIVQGSGLTVLFVTHSIDEAIALADRIVVVSRRPGRVRAIVNVDIPRPRMANEGPLASRSDYGDLREELWSMIREDVDRG